MPGEVSGYPSDVTDEEWAFVLPYLLLCREDSARRRHDLRRVSHGVRYAARTGGQWRYPPREYGPWWAVYQQMRRWLDAGVAGRGCGWTRVCPRRWWPMCSRSCASGPDAKGSQARSAPTAARSRPRPRAEPGLATTGPSGARGRKAHIAVDTLGHLLALTVTPARSGRPRPGCAAGRRSAAGHRKHGRAGLRRPGIHRAKTPSRPHSNTASGLKWSSTPWPGGASCCCHADGSWSGPSPGPRASRDAHGTTDGSAQPWKASTPSPSPSS